MLKNRALVLAFLSSTSILLTACEATVNINNGATGSSSSVVASQPGNTSSGTTSSGSSTTTSSTSSSPATPASSTEPSLHFELTGSYNATQVGGGALLVPIENGSLKLTLTAGAGLALAGTDYTVGFDCEQLQVQVGNEVQTAFVKKSGYTDLMLGMMGYDPCALAQTSWTYDFSSALFAGEVDANVQIYGAESDNCRIYGNMSEGGCALNSIYSDYSIDGYLSYSN